MAVRLFVLMLCCLGVLCVNQSRADGPADNDLTTVRRIPTLGIDVPAKRETQLREKLGKFTVVWALQANFLLCVT